MQEQSEKSNYQPNKNFNKAVLFLTDSSIDR